MTALQRLVDKIVEEFSAHNYSIKVVVLDGNGDDFVVFEGVLTDFTVKYLVNVLREPSCFYFFTISTATPKLYDQGGDYYLKKKEICWLTDPQAPTIKDIKHNCFNIQCAPVQFCGVENPTTTDAITYTLEMAEGVPWKNGFTSQYMNDLTASNYKQIYRGNVVSVVQVHDLKSSNWYHTRLVVEYLGIIVISETRTVHTVSGKPSPPSLPRLYIQPVPSSFDLQNPVPSRLDVIIKWGASQPHGSKITTYQVQIKRLDTNGNAEAAAKARNPIANPSNGQTYITKLTKENKSYNQWIGAKGRNLDTNRFELFLKNVPKSTQEKFLPSISQTGPGPGPIPGQSPSNSPKNTSLVSASYGLNGELGGTGTFSNDKPASEWSIIYNNLHRKVKINAPEMSSEGEWSIRVRAKNAEGWSGFSPLLVVNGLTHPSLFDVFTASSMVKRRNAQPITFKLPPQMSGNEVWKSEGLPEDSDVDYNGVDNMGYAGNGVATRKLEGVGVYMGGADNISSNTTTDEPLSKLIIN